MKDTIIKGNGKSRILKAPADIPDNFADWRDQMMSGNAYLDIAVNTNTDITNPNAGLDVVGTPLSKGNLLSDATQTALGLQSDPTVNDAIYRLYERSYQQMMASFKLLSNTTITVAGGGSTNALKIPFYSTAVSNFDVDNARIRSWGDGDLDIEGVSGDYYHVWISGNVLCQPSGGTGSKTAYIHKGTSQYHATEYQALNTTHKTTISIPEVYIGKIKVGELFGISIKGWANNDVLSTGTTAGYMGTWVSVRAVKAMN